METSKDPIIEKWLELNIKRAEFEFYAGGDSMGDTNLMFYNEKDEEVAFEYKDEIDQMVYDNVEFYVNSNRTSHSISPALRTLSYGSGPMRALGVASRQGCILITEAWPSMRKFGNKRPVLPVGGCRYLSI